jgi:hypothetical protein
MRSGIRRRGYGGSPDPSKANCQPTDMLTMIGVKGTNMAPEIRVLKPRHDHDDENKQVTLNDAQQATDQEIVHRNDAISRVNSGQLYPPAINLLNGVVSLQAIAIVKPVALPTSQRLALNKRVLRNPPPQQHGHLTDPFVITINGVNHACPARSVGSLIVVWRSDLNHYELLTDPEGKSLSSDRFTTFEDCFSAAVELEQTFVIEDAIVLRSSETWDAIAAVIRQHWLREQVKQVLGAGQVDC